MKSNRITFSLGRDDQYLKDWYESIPDKYRTMMVKIAVLNAVNSGLADVDAYLPWVRRKPSPGTQELPYSVKKPAEQAHPEASKMPLQERPQERKPAEKPTEKPVAQKGEDLLKFTLAHLPEGCTPDLQACAERFPRPVPYTLKELITLKGMLKALDEQEAQTGQS
ncbi:hypothetical protein H7F10_06925 [Acidithiobacillus sp. HP-6]|uniref:hypothetical protein n=1 Tax=unclassified Acidithiobacillus TaxID=2614800 RepID=UPI0018799352|nr:MULTISPECIES: hypothetical protein [unclassified Acidithiobacillus]MBE7562687.1 hypothetical protein [Acidithiobacillus sp. HP-6]MBE7570517.1 hypothetical protein [Acidithiobacillus sp. HP-2]